MTCQFKIGDRVVAAKHSRNFMNEFGAYSFIIETIEVAAHSTKEKWPGAEWWVRGRSENGLLVGAPDNHVHLAEIMLEPEFSLDEIHQSQGFMS